MTGRVLSPEKCCRGEERGAKHTFTCPVYLRSVEAFRRIQKGTKP